MNYARTHTHATRMRLTGNVLEECGKNGFFSKKAHKKEPSILFTSVKSIKNGRKQAFKMKFRRGARKIFFQIAKKRLTKQRFYDKV